MASTSPLRRSNITLDALLKASDIVSRRGAAKPLIVDGAVRVRRILEDMMATQQTKASPVSILGLAHIGIRVHDLERSVRFYELLGFTKTAGPIGPEPVAILDHPSGVEVNLVLNATSANEPNVLMDGDGPEKHPGITHFALLCPDILEAQARLTAAGIALSGGPVRFGPGAQAIFVRDPDRNVIELHQRG